MTHEQLIDAGWEPFPEESTEEIFAYLYFLRGDVFMLTVSSDYVKLIFKGLTKEENIQLFKDKHCSIEQIQNIIKK